MESTTRLILPEVRDALERDPESLTELTDELLPADLADLATELEDDLALRFIKVLPVDVSARLLEACEEDLRNRLFALLSNEALETATAVVDEMAPDDRADLFADLSDDLRQQVLGELDPEESRDIRQLLKYPEDSAGGLMTTEFVALAAATTVGEAIDQVRSSAEEMETIYTAYAVDSHGTLQGVVSLRDLVTSPARRTIEDIMNPNVVTVDIETDQEEVAQVMAKYDLLALPVVDRSHHVVGVITVDDVIDVVEEEATEDAHKIGAVEPIEQPYMNTRVWGFLRARAPWLIALFIVQFFSSSVLEHYTLEIASVAMLMWFVPLIISSGGNAGSQSATLVIRAMAVGEVEPSQALKVLSREALIGMALGATLGLIGAARVMMWEATRSITMALAIGVSVAVVVVFGSLLGAGIPLLLERLRIDPAVSSTPFIASVVDIGGLVIYFEVARLFLG